jgi:hypothetical protein
MKSKKRIGLIAVSALAIGAVALPAGAQAARVSEDAAGGLVPAEINPAVGPTVSPSFVQEFKISGKNAKKRQVLDVDVTVNGFGNGPDSNQDLSAQLVNPKRENVFLFIPTIGSAMVNLEFSDQSQLSPCNPLTFNSDDCNYLQGGDAAGTVGSMTGELNSPINPTFRGNNASGTWRLIWRDNDSNTTTTTLGETELSIKTGRKFAKEGK